LIFSFRDWEQYLSHKEEFMRRCSMNECGRCARKCFFL
jgi:hypothetical protein